MGTPITAKSVSSSDPRLTTITIAPKMKASTTGRSARFLVLSAIMHNNVANGIRQGGYTSVGCLFNTLRIVTSMVWMGSGGCHPLCALIASHRRQEQSELSILTRRRLLSPPSLRCSATAARQARALRCAPSRVLAGSCGASRPIRVTIPRACQPARNLHRGDETD
jgi:hypothetical protein